MWFLSCPSLALLFAVGHVVEISEAGVVNLESRSAKVGYLLARKGNFVVSNKLCFINCVLFAFHLSFPTVVAATAAQATAVEEDTAVAAVEADVGADAGEAATAEGVATIVVEVEEEV